MTRPTPAMFQLNSPFLNIEDVSIKAFPTKGDHEFWIQILSKQQAWGHQLIRNDTQGHFPLPRHWVTIPLVLAVSLGIPKRPGKSAGCNRWLGWSWPTWTKFFGSFHVVSLEVKVFRRHIIVFMQNATKQKQYWTPCFFLLLEAGHATNCLERSFSPCRWMKAFRYTFPQFPYHSLIP